MSGIFICYRREDSAGHAGRIFDRLRERFGNDRVFMDVAGIEPGVDFVEAIDSAVGSCDALIVVIGRKWLNCTDTAGNRRLDDPKDFIRLETATALRRRIRVIPVLIQDAAMPTEKDLPEDLLKLARRQAIEIRDVHWESDIQVLIEALLKMLPSEHKPEPAEKTSSSAITPDPKNNRLVWLISTLTAIVVALGGLLSSIESVKNTFSGLFSSQPESKTEITVPAPTQVPAPQETVVVPDLIGLSLDAAVAQLHRKQLQPGPATPRPADRPPGTVMEQDPAAGHRLAPGSQVHLVVAENPAEPKKHPEPELVTVPKLTGLSQQHAKELLKKAGLVIAETRQVNSRETKPGTVLEQNPPAGKKVVKGNAVTLVVAIEPPASTLVTVPKLGGLTEAMARESLARAGLTTGVIHRKESDRSRPGTVINQKPGSGQQVPKGMEVEFLIAVAPTRTEPAARPSNKVTIFTLGEPTDRRFWDREQAPAYSIKMARLYSIVLKELASGSTEFNIDPGTGHEIRTLKKMLRDTRRLCESTKSAIVFIATANEPYASSDVESAYWPELHQTVVICNSGKQYEQNNTLSPKRGDEFPFEKAMAEAMQRFAQGYRHLLK